MDTPLYMGAPNFSTATDSELRRSEVVALTLRHIQQRDNRWRIIDLVGKQGRVRTIPMPTWVKGAIDAWTLAASISEGPVLLRVNHGDRVQADGISEKVVWQLLQKYALAVGLPGIAPHDLRRTCAKLCRAAGGELEQIQILLGHQSVQTTERYLGTKQDLVQCAERWDQAESGDLTVGCRLAPNLHHKRLPVNLAARNLVLLFRPGHQVKTEISTRIERSFRRCRD